jgi:hypothetical protein
MSLSALDQVQHLPLRRTFDREHGHEHTHTHTHGLGPKAPHHRVPSWWARSNCPVITCRLRWCLPVSIPVRVNWSEQIIQRIPRFAGMATEEASKQGCDYYDFAVIGAGRMGASIAGALALNGARVAVHDRSDFDRKKGLEIMRADMKQHEEEGLISEEGRMQALSHVFFVDSLVEVNPQRKMARYEHRCYASRREQQ